MPFTFSHPAIVLPVTYLNKKWYSLSALVMGSMIPDFEYFIRMRGFSRYSHTWTGLFWFDIPLALVSIFIFHNIVRDTLIQNLPSWLNIRLSVFEKFNWNKYFLENIIVVFISLIIGIASHLVWDDFTHSDGYFVKVIPFLHGHVHILNHRLYIPELLQYGCSVIGGLVILLAAFKLPEGKNTKQNTILNFWLLVSVMTIVIFDLRVYVGKIFNRHLHPEDVIVTIISGGLIAITVLSFFLNESKKHKIFRQLGKIRNRQG